MNQKKIIGLMACDPQGVMGHQGKLPWNYPEELKIFEKRTRGQVMIMGRKTYEDTPTKFLELCFNIVLSKKFDSPLFVKENIVFIPSLECLAELSRLPRNKTMFMIGGAEIARLFLKENLISEFLLTQIKKSFKGNTFFPLELLQGWPVSVEKKTLDFIIYRYENPDK